MSRTDNFPRDNNSNLRVRSTRIIASTLHKIKACARSMLKVVNFKVTCIYQKFPYILLANLWHEFKGCPRAGDPCGSTFRASTTPRHKHRPKATASAGVQPASSKNKNSKRPVTKVTPTFARVPEEAIPEILGAIENARAQDLR